MRPIFLLIITALISTQCILAPDPRGEYRYTDKTGLPSCLGSNCCSRSNECVTICRKVFSRSGPAVINRCKTLPYHEVENIQDLWLNIRRPFIEDLRRINVTESFRLVLALDYTVFVFLFKNLYRRNDARRFLVWLAEEDYLATELMALQKEQQRDFLYELLATAGDRDSPGPVEEGLATKIEFGRSFFEMIVEVNLNTNLLNITHDIIKSDLCGLYGASTQQALCVLRIYCRTDFNDNAYVHSEDLRGEIARRIDDPDFFKFVRQNVYYGGATSILTPNLNNTVCDFICNQNNMRGCEGRSLRNKI